LTAFEALTLGAMAGLVATCMLSVLARLLPGLQNLTHKPIEPPPHEKQGKPSDSFDPEVVRAWQDQARSPSASGTPSSRPPPVFTAEGALVAAEGPGPEGAAAEFAVKIAAGLFGRDLTASAKRAGKVVHFVYGSLWGALYGLIQASFSVPWLLAGVIQGLVVWGIGPGWLCPMMKVLLRPKTLRPSQNALLIAGHVLYGVLVAFVFARLVAWRLA
jgi:hypothetical protein